MSASSILNSDMEFLRISGLTKEFPIKSGKLFGRNSDVVKAVSDVSFNIARGEVLGLVGESGCGKTTLGRCVVRLLEPTSGQIEFRGKDISSLSGKPLRSIRKQIQIVFQDPYSSLHPRMTVSRILQEPMRMLDLSSDERAQKVDQLLELVGLGRRYSSFEPHQLSGGQRQRVGIARALAVNPQLLVLDEPVSALDVSVQAGILNLLKRLQSEFSLACLFISHDLSVVRHICDKVAVMYLGKIVEIAPRSVLFSAPRHPYTRALLSAVPHLESVGGTSDKIILNGDIPNPVSPPTGCRFRTRCWKATEQCALVEPPLRPGGEGSFACHHPEPYSNSR